MSENLQLLQQLAQKPSVNDWFLQAFSQVYLKVTDTGEEFTILNRSPEVEVKSGFQVPERKRKGLLAKLGFDPSGWYIQQFTVPLQSESIRALADVFSDDVVDIEEEYRIVSFLIEPLLKATLSMPIMQNWLLLKFLKVHPFWQQALLDSQGNETQQVTAVFAHKQWLIISGYYGKPKHRYLIRPDQIMALQRHVHQAEQQDSLLVWLAAVRWFWNWRAGITVTP